MKHITKDPDAVLDYGWDWAAWLASGDTIASYTLTVTSGGTVTIDSDSDDGTSVVAFISGGTTGRSVVTCHIVTTAGREDDRSIILDVRDR